MSKKLQRKDDFWDRFDSLFDNMSDFFGDFPDRMRTRFEGMDLAKGNSYSSQSSTIVQDGNKVVVKTVNGKFSITVNGKEYVPKEEEKQ